MGKMQDPSILDGGVLVRFDFLGLKGFMVPDCAGDFVAPLGLF